MRRARGANATVAWLRASDDPNAVAGAAFLVSPDLALTCAHVVRDHLGLGKPTPRDRPTAPVTLRFEAVGRELAAHVAESGWWPDGAGGELDDLAVLRLAEPLADLDCVALALAQPRPKEPCYVYGVVGGYQDVGQTVHAQLAAQPNARDWHQLDAEAGRGRSYFVQRGFSGAPVLDELGNAIWGMVVAVDSDDHLVAFAISAADLRRAVRSAASAEAVPQPTGHAPGPADDLARDALNALRAEYEGRLAEERAAYERQLQELRDAVAGLAERARQPAERHQAEAALRGLLAGDTQPAEDILGAELAAAPTATPEERRQAADMARRIGALIYLHDTRRAIAAYQRAAELDPDDVWTWLSLGRLRRRAESLATAEDAFTKALDLARRLGSERDESVAYNDLGDVRRAQGDLEGALAAYEQSQEIFARLAAQDPGNAGWQRDLSISHERIGDVRVAQGDLEGALAAYGDSLAIRERLAAQDPGNAEWQRDLSVSHNKLGDVRVAQGDLEGALAAYGDSLAIRERLAAQDPGNAEWQRDLIVSHWKLADLAEKRGAPASEAKQHWRAALDVAKDLQQTGRLAPTDGYFVEAIEARLAALDQQAEAR